MIGRRAVTAVAADASSMSSGRRLRVLLLSGFPAIGGPLPKLAPVVAEGLRRGGCLVEMMGWSAHSAEPEPYPVKVRDRTRDLARILARVRTWRPDVLYVATTHRWPALVRDIPLALALPRRLPLVLHFHGSECDKLEQPGQGVFTALSKWLVGRASAVLLLSQEEVHTWDRVCPGTRFELVSNPYVPPLDRSPTAASDQRGRSGPPTMLFVGRLVRDKGIFELLDATSIIRHQQPCRLVVAGAGPVAEEVGRRIATMGLSDLVELRGYITGDDLLSAYRDADLFVLPSYREGFPLVVMEAMDHGLPVVTTPIRGCADHLEPGVNALFTPPRDAESLAAALLRLLGDRDLRERMGAANQRKVREFAPAKVMPRYVEILRGVAAGGAP